MTQLESYIKGINEKLELIKTTDMTNITFLGTDKMSINCGTIQAKDIKVTV